MLGLASSHNLRSEERGIVPRGGRVYGMWASADGCGVGASRYFATILLFSDCEKKPNVKSLAAYVLRESASLYRYDQKQITKFSQGDKDVSR